MIPPWQGEEAEDTVVEAASTVAEAAFMAEVAASTAAVAVFVAVDFTAEAFVAVAPFFMVAATGWVEDAPFMAGHTVHLQGQTSEEDAPTPPTIVATSAARDLIHPVHRMRSELQH